MVTLDKMKKAYLKARINKRRSDDQVDFEMRWRRNIAALCRDVNNRTLRPTAYTFVTLKPRPREVFACDMGMRVIHHYLDMRLRPLIEARLTDRTYNNRKGYGQTAAINQLITDIYAVSEGFTRDAWMIKLDLKGYFPNANQDIVYHQLEEIILSDYFGEDKEDLLYMLRCAVFSYPTQHCYRKSELWKWERFIDKDKSLFSKPLGVGAAIGHLIWQNAMNYYLNDIDHWLVDECGFAYIRFVDDMVIVTTNKECVLGMIPEIRRRLAYYGCELHPKKFYCQHYTKGVEFLGSHIKLDRVYPNKNYYKKAVTCVRNQNKAVSIRRLVEFLASINSYTGTLKTRNGYALLRNLWDRVNESWKEYCELDLKRCCVVAKDGYRTNQLLSKKYNLSKHYNHDTRAEKRTA